MVKALALFAVGASAMTWEEYKQQFGKVYNGDESARQAIFESNKKMWGQHESGAILGATQFSDLTLEEFQALPIRGFAASMKSDLPNLGTFEADGDDAAAIDWTAKGAVTPVKNQGQCGSCWAFSTTGGLEGAWQLATGNLVSMSEQQFVDCDTVDSGCNGGLMDNAFKWAEGQSVATEASYAYNARKGSCKKSFTTAIPSGGVTGFKDVARSESALKSALQNSPISVAIEADQAVFQQYTGGVIKKGCGTQLDHGVLAVGINDDGSIKVKNSWGASWGVNGFVNMEASQCGITQSASIPVVSGSPGPAPGPAPPTPPPAPPSPSTGHHYEAPPCQPDEIAGAVQGAGQLCAPKCNDDGSCSQDFPEDVTKPKPQCILQDQSGGKYCALSCGLLSGGNCPAAAKCSSTFEGVCTYPESTAANSVRLTMSTSVTV